ncbi:MAG: glucokinase [Acidobacteria bacterium]|nr:glucokinase [Acidobacteriota bacterium]
MILAGDIGGTHARLALFTASAGALAIHAQQSYASHLFASLQDVIQAFLRDHPAAVEAACFGVAGPVIRNRATATNLAWEIDGAILSQALQLPPVLLLNDLAAYAYGALALPPQDCVMLQAGAAAEGNRALIAAGTGLGISGILWRGGRHWPMAAEGGHADFAPIDDLGVDLYRYVRAKFGRASFERVLSGPGLQNIFEFLRDTGRAPQPPELAAELAHSADIPAAISAHGLAGDYAICEQAVEIFCRYYGACAGNTALNFMATGGLYVGGGIAIRMLARTETQKFLEAFNSKGRLTAVLQAIPVILINNEYTGLIGAAHAAADSLATDRQLTIGN